MLFQILFFDQIWLSTYLLFTAFSFKKNEKFQDLIVHAYFSAQGFQFFLADSFAKCKYHYSLLYLYLFTLCSIPFNNYRISLYLSSYQCCFIQINVILTSFRLLHCSIIQMRCVHLKRHLCHFMKLNRGALRRHRIPNP